MSPHLPKQDTLKAEPGLLITMIARIAITITFSIVLFSVLLVTLMTLFPQLLALSRNPQNRALHPTYSLQNLRSSENMYTHSICICICVYTSICAYMHVYTYIYTHKYIGTQMNKSEW